MDAEDSQTGLRFIKRIPPSGGANSWKLTLSHKVVREKLQHLIDQPFQLASSPNSVQTWEASIAPRRNKDRNEYILQLTAVMPMQGWRLFAEAHGLRAGDQISFELVGDRRLVVKCIKPVGSERPLAPVRCSSDSPEATELQPVKSAKVTPSSSPSRQRMQWTEENAPRSDRSRSLQPAVSAREIRTGRCYSSPAVAALHTEPPAMAQRVQSWLSLNLPSPRAQSTLSAGSKLLSPEGAALSTDMATPAHLDFGDPHEETLLSHFEAELPGIFDDMSRELDSVVPDIPSAPAERSVVRSLQSSKETSRTQTHHAITPPVPGLQSHETELRALVTSIQDRLDQSTRSALQATMGLENCVVEMTNPAGQACTRETQAKMFRFLSSLKESLWQMLLVSNDSYGKEM